MKANKIILPLIIVIAATAFFSIFIVKEINQAIVLQFGDPKRIIIAVSYTHLTLPTTPYV